METSSETIRRDEEVVRIFSFAELEKPRGLSRWAALWLWTFAVILPATTIGIELATRICAKTLFEPLPSPLHVLLVAAVPLANLAALVALRRGGSGIGPSAWKGLAFGNGLALGVSLYYSLVFLPLVPISVVFIIAYGLGLLSLAPLLALVSGLVLWRKLRARMPARGRVASWGLVAGLLALMAIGAPAAVTRFGLARAVEGSPAQRTRAIRLLRTFGDRELILRACYERAGEVGDLLSFVLRAQHVTPAAAREVYYRVTGEPFNSVPAPKLASLRGELGEEAWDFDQGGAAVGGVVAGLSLAGSRLDGSLDAAAAIGYLEWTLDLHNESPTVREARAVVALPPGGTVTRATLWIDGEEREAAFGPRATVRTAYEKVVRARRDPLLVTTAGPDRVLVQCFPVPAGGGMKVRLGISVPLVVEAGDRARLHLPHFLERNFAVGPELRHAVWVEAGDVLASAGPRSGDPEGAMALASARSLRQVVVRDAVDDAELASHAVVAHRDPSAVSSWAVDPLDPAFDVVQSLEPLPPSIPGSVFVVLDGSRGLAEEADEIRQVLAAPGLGPRPVVLLAGDEVATVEPGQVRRRRFHGGTDNVPALVEAWDRAARSARGVVVWVHAPQPVALSSVGELEQRCERAPEGPRLIALAAAPGPNRIFDALDACPLLEVAPRRGDLAADLRALLDGEPTTGARLAPRRERLSAGSRRSDGHETSAHLIRLWARAEADRLVASSRDRTAATALAVSYRLVTPLSGAVVLETASQYEEAGLQPASPQSVPTVPEPSTVALLVVVTLAALAAIARRRRPRWRAVAS